MLDIVVMNDTCRSFFFQAEDGIRDIGVTGVQTCAFFFQAEDGIRDIGVTGVQTRALPILIAFSSLALGTYVVIVRRTITTYVPSARELNAIIGPSPFKSTACQIIVGFVAAQSRSAKKAASRENPARARPTPSAASDIRTSESSRIRLCRISAVNCCSGR